jgi:MinD-like ATPase involved in chromosome partitioning or flagellar assembly
MPAVAETSAPAVAEAETIAPEPEVAPDAVARLAVGEAVLSGVAGEAESLSGADVSAASGLDDRESTPGQRPSDHADHTGTVSPAVDEAGESEKDVVGPITSLEQHQRANHDAGASGDDAAAAEDKPADGSPARPARPVVKVTGERAAERPLRVVERALRSQPGRGADGWRGEKVVVVPGGHRPGKPDQLQRDRARARLPVEGARRIVVLGCTRGAGQTTTVLLAGDMLAGLRGQPVAVLDLNPGRGSLTDQAAAIPGLVQGSADTVGGYGTPAAVGSPSPDSGLQVISGSAAAEGGDDAGRILDLVAARYPLTIADPAASYVPRTLDVADQLLIVAPASAEAAGALAMTFEWLEAHGHGRLAASAITVLNGVSGPTTEHVEHAANVANGRCRAIVKVPWDSHLKELTQERRPGQPGKTHGNNKHTATGGGRATLSESAGHQGPSLLGPALTQAYTALAGVLVAGLADPGQLRSARV